MKVHCAAKGPCRRDDDRVDDIRREYVGEQVRRFRNLDTAFMAAEDPGARRQLAAEMQSCLDGIRRARAWN